jgi:hypothetical protein
MQDAGLESLSDNSAFDKIFPLRHLVVQLIGYRQSNLNLKFLPVSEPVQKDGPL